MARSAAYGPVALRGSIWASKLAVGSGIMPVGWNVATAMGASEGAGYAMVESSAELGPPSLPPLSPLCSKTERFWKQGEWQGCMEGALMSFITAKAQARSEPGLALVVVGTCHGQGAVR